MDQAMASRSFKIKWKAGFKRVNYDLHNVPAFTALSCAYYFAEGMVWAFGWFEALVYVLPPALQRHRAGECEVDTSGLRLILWT